MLSFLVLLHDQNCFLPLVLCRARKQNRKTAQSELTRLEGVRQSHRCWPNRAAIGQLNVVIADGKDPRLVLDSTVCNANPLCKIPERVALPSALPSALDVQRSFLREDCFGNMRCTALDFKAACKCVKVAPHEQGALLFEVEAQLYHYIFGARFSAMVGPGWRTHRSRPAPHVAKFSHRAWLNVDDLLLLFCSAEHARATGRTVAFLSVLNAPVSWKKAQVGRTATWCRWTFDFSLESLRLHAPKLLKLREQLARVAQSKKIPRKKLGAHARTFVLIWRRSIATFTAARAR